MICITLLGLKYSIEVSVLGHLLLNPQFWILYVDTRTRVWSNPQLACNTVRLSRLSTGTGAGSSAGLPTPNLPFLPLPHTHNSPLDVNANECTRPPARLATFSFSRSLITAGEELSPSLPSWHPAFQPHEYTNPSESRANEWPRPALRCKTLLMMRGPWILQSGIIFSPPECMVEIALVLPSCPRLLSPKLNNSPSSEVSTKLTLWVSLQVSAKAYLIKLHAVSPRVGVWETFLLRAC